MSALDIAACASPIVPAVMLALTLYGPWYSKMMRPLQFAMLPAEASLAATTKHMVPLLLAVGGFLIAFLGLAALVLRDRWIEHRVSRIFDWEAFEEALASYSAQRSGRDQPPLGMP